MKKVSRISTLKRPIHPMPSNIGSLLEKHGLLAQCKARPLSQQNDYIGWITKARLETTKQIGPNKCWMN